MPFPESVRREAIERSGRCCCVCHQFKGRNVEVHHIVPEADGGPSTLENAIALCFDCHAEAGHYNPRHPRGTRYSPDELRAHRDKWWDYREQNYAPGSRPAGYKEPLSSGRGVPSHEREIGVLFSHRADIAEQRETVRFSARLLASERHETSARVTWTELFAREDGTFLVYVETNERGDWGEAWIDGDPEHGHVLRLADLHERYPSLATAAGLQRVRDI